MDDLNQAVMARDGVRAQALRKALAACRLASQASGLPPTVELSELETRRVLHHMVQTLSDEAHRMEFESMDEPARQCRAELAVLAPYLWLPLPPEALPHEAQDPTDAPEGLHRLHHRLNVGPEFTVRFFLMDEPFTEVRVVNLGAGGCCLQLDPELAELLVKGSHLHNLTFCHPDLPDTPVLAEIVYLLGKVPHGRAPGTVGLRVLAGLKFLNPPAAFEDALAAYAESRLGTTVWPGPRERIPRWDTEHDVLLCAEPGPGCTASFFLLGEAFHDVPVLNLGAGGCCLRLDAELSELLKPGTRLHNLAIHHAEVPTDLQHGEAVYVMRTGGQAHATVGVHFLHAKVEYQAQISRLVRNRLRAAGSHP